MKVVLAVDSDFSQWLRLAEEVQSLFGPLVQDAGFLGALRKNIERGSAYCVRGGDGSTGNILLGGLLWSAHPPRYEIGWLAVSGLHRRQAIGRSLVEHALCVARRPAVVGVTTFTKEVTGGAAALEFYRRLGFIAARVDPINALPSRQRLELVLSATSFYGTDMKRMPIREMRAEDVARCIFVRTKTWENCWTLEGLAKVGVTEGAVIEKLSKTHRGWVCEVDGQIVGFSMSDPSNGEFWVVAVLPEFEGRGIGRRLVEIAQTWLHENGWDEIWLWTSPNPATRAYQLYRKLGWVDGETTDGELIMRHRQVRALAL